MSLPPNKSLLPAGLTDILPPDAAFEAEAVEKILKTYASFGYDRVKPPLMEYENSLLADTGAALTEHAFRLMDPMAQRMLALRPDITMQVARVAASRLADLPRPLRLSYAGEVLRVRSSQLRSERQFGQVGAELVGTESIEGDVEIISMTTEALSAVGVDKLTVDLSAPWIVPALIQDATLSAQTTAAFREALDRRDVAAISALSPELGTSTVDALDQLVRASGPISDVVPVIERLDLPPKAAGLRERFLAITEKLAAAVPEVSLTIDAIERRGHEYYTEIKYAFFSRDIGRDLGRGGRYLSVAGEPGTGVSLFMSTIVELLAKPAATQRVYLPAGTDPDVARNLRASGWTTIASFEPAADGDTLAAQRQGCTHIWAGGQSQPLDPTR
jgi:ATP phosphoribosyltransferase regulatory subunit